MKVSLNWIRLMNANYGCSSSSELDDVEKLIEKIGAQLGAVEEVINLGERYKGIVVAKVVSAEKHPDADKLKVCWIDDGGVVKDVPRNDKGYVQVVCGAPNVAAGQLVAWLPPGSTVPATFDKDPLVLEARQIRGQLSSGMIGSPKELALGDNHEGILVLDDGKPGEDFSSKFFLDDYIIDIENKMFTHRPDCFGILGIARELAGISGKSYKSPDWYREDASLPSDGRKNVLKLSVKNDVPDLVPRFCAVAIKDVKVADSPIWLQSFLARSGIRPVNNIADITNWFMLATAQPLHAYDYDKVVKGAKGEGLGAILGIRNSKKGEKLSLLNGKEITLDDGAVVITDGQKPIGLGGVMGGANTEVDENTKNIILECANFDMNQTRRTAMAYGLFTDAATRFTKNQSPRQNLAVLAKTVHDTLDLAGGRVASPMIDDRHFKIDEKPIKLSAAFVNSRLGSDLSASAMKKILENVEFGVEIKGDKFSVTVPFWRTDIEIQEDIVEEIGRLHGYDKLPIVLPKRGLTPAAKDPALEFEARLRDILKRAGANEVLTYSFVHESLLQKAGQDNQQAYHIRNALSPGLQYYRLSLTPSLLDKAHPNIRANFDEFAIYEIGKAHGKSETEDGLPKELDRLAMVFASKKPAAGAPFFLIKHYVEFLARTLNLNFRYEPLNYTAFPTEKHKLLEQMLAIYEPKRSALIFAGEKLAGVVGEFRQDAKVALKLPSYCAGTEIFLSALQNSSSLSYVPLNKYPETIQDICFKVSSFTANVSYGVLENLIVRELDGESLARGYLYSISPIDIFQREDDDSHIQITWRIILWHPERTLTTAETNKLLDGLAERAKKELNAERI
jgi:phenylalanyl-tRNA synthetase beta chain